MDRKNSFDLIRVLAACAVLFSHCFPLAGQNANEPISRFSRYGSLGEIAVDSFFIVSGFLVTTSYLRGSEPIDFLIKRALRLLPALWCAILLTVFLLGPAVTTLPLGRYFASSQTHDYLRNLYLSIRYALPGVFASNPYPIAVNGSLWTLPVEAFMYVVTLLLGLSGSLNRRACLGVVLIFVLLHFGVPATSVTKNGVVLHQMPYAQLTGLGILYFSGAFYAVLRFEWKENKNMVLVCAFALVTLARSPLAELVSYIALPYLILSLAHFRSRFSRGVSKAGDFSYGIYLYAFPVQQTVALLLGDKVSPLQIGLLSLPITLLLAGASWYLVEKPMLELKRFLGRRRGAILQES